MLELLNLLYLINFMLCLLCICQDPALTVLSVMFLFNVSLFVLCLSTWLCFILCLPCAPLVLPPCFPWSRPLVKSLSSTRLFDCVHLILVCSAALYRVPFPCVFAGSFWCLPVSWSCVYTCTSYFDLAQVIFGSLI